MTNKDAAFADIEQELATTRKFLERVPEDKLAWRPHDKSMTMGRLSMHVAEIPRQGTALVEGDEFHFSPPGSTAPVRRETTSRAEVLAEFDQNAAALREAMAKVDDAALARPWSFHAFGKHIFTVPKAAAIRTRVVSHLIHHRAQLGVYYRLLDIPLPGTSYGPSADER